MIALPPGFDANLAIDIVLLTMLLVIAGAVVSRTWTSKIEDDPLCVASCVEQATVVWPSAKVPPDTGRQVTVVLPLTASWAVGSV